MTKASRIPTAARHAVRQRDLVRCARCGSNATVGQWHHRRSRWVRDEHTHHPCNGLWLCADCHSWCHHNPTEAKASGWIVSRYVAEPGSVPVHHGVWGWVLLECNSDFTFTDRRPDALD